MPSFRPDWHDNYRVGWICALPIELAAALGMLDEVHEETYRYGNDTNIYSLGRMGTHNVVIACMPYTQMGTNSAATVATQMISTFQSIEFGLLVGIGGGVPSARDIRLGDVVVSRPGPSHGGVVQYDFGKTTGSRFMRTGFLNTPPTLLLNALAILEAAWVREEPRFMDYVSKLSKYSGFSPEVTGPDILYKASYTHLGGDTCDRCDQKEVVKRKSRHDKVRVHYGTIASGNRVMRDARERDRISAELGGILCFEMEAAGLMNTFSWLVIRGICDYADSHKNKKWQPYAAGTAAAYAKELLSIVPAVGMSRLGLVNLYPAERKGVADRPLNPRRSRVATPNDERGFDRDPAVGKDQGQRAKETELLRRLNSSTYRARKDRNPDRIPGTCEWFTAHKLFREWQDSDTSRILWVSADPGCGKSVLAKYLIDHVLQSNKSRTVCYFFFKSDFDDQRTIVGALSCIIYQLFMRRRHLLSQTILDQFEVGGEEFIGSFDELWATLINVAEDDNTGEIVCVLDAIDECEERGRSELMKALCKLYGTKKGFNMKFLVTSRPYGEIRRGFQPLQIPELPIIHLKGENEEEMRKISQEIDLFIKARVTGISGKLLLKHEEQELLLEKLMLVPNRTYLWVHLTLDLIESHIDVDKAGIVEATSHLPRSVDEAYEKILSKSRNPQKAKKLLHMIVAATRPLTLKEMSLALALTEKQNLYRYSDLDLKSEERFREDVRDLCGLFVTVIDLKLYLLHQTAKDFLVQNSPANHPNTVHEDLKWKHSLQPRESHRILRETCIRYLLFEDFRSNPFSGNQVLSQYVDSHIFLDYSAKSWVTHLHESDRLDDKIMESLLSLCDVSSCLCLTWFRVYWTSTQTGFPESFTCLMVASYFGLAGVVRRLLETKGNDLNLEDRTYGRTALSWAAGNGFAAVVELLINEGNSRVRNTFNLIFGRGRRQVNSEDKSGRTPLFYAAWNGHMLVVELLVKAGAQTDLRDDIGATPLSYAIVSGREEVTKLLSRRGVNAFSGDEDIMSRNLLFSAVKKGREYDVKLLLKMGRVDPDSQYYSGQTPLCLAARNGFDVIVKLLLETGKVNPDSRDYSGQTPLYWAAKNGHLIVVKLLLRTNRVGVDFRDNAGRTSLFWAARNGHDDIVKILLETGRVDPDSRENGYGRTPLLWAAENGHSNIVGILLDSGRVDPDAKDYGYGRTALSRAAENGNEAIIKLLLDSGRVDPGSKDNGHGRTPLSRAAENGHVAIVRLLLRSHKVKPGSKENGYGRTPLSRAAENGHEAVVRLLLRIDSVDPNSKDHKGRTALSWAEKNGHENIVKLLVESSRSHPY